MTLHNRKNQTDKKKQTITTHTKNVVPGLYQSELKQNRGNYLLKRIFFKNGENDAKYNNLDVQGLLQCCAVNT